MEQLTAAPNLLTLPQTDARWRIDMKWLVLACHFPRNLMGSLDATIANVAFPAIGRTFPDASQASLSWVLNGYTIAFAALLIVAGRVRIVSGGGASSSRVWPCSRWRPRRAALLRLNTC